MTKTLKKIDLFIERFSSVLLVISVFVYAIFKFRLKQKVELFEVRNKIARDLHDEIGSNLSSIALFSAVAKEKTWDQTNQVSTLLKKISEWTNEKIIPRSK